MKDKARLDVKKVLQEFCQAQESAALRRGTFKVEAPFEEAMKKILKAKPEPKKPKRSAKSGKKAK